MKPPKFAGKLVYFFGYPLFRILIKGTNRAYVVVYNDKEVLLTKNWLGFQKKWRLPGGGIEHGESPLAAVQRELQEEVGISADSSQIVQLTEQPVQADYKYSYYLFACRVSTEIAVKPDEREILEAKFIHKNVLKNTVISEEAQQALRLIGWL